MKDRQVQAIVPPDGPADVLLIQMQPITDQHISTGVDCALVLNEVLSGTEPLQVKSPRRFVGITPFVSEVISY